MSDTSTGNASETADKITTPFIDSSSISMGDLPKDVPDWVVKMVHRNDVLNRRYALAHEDFTEAWDKFIWEIYVINQQHGTEFTVRQALKDFSDRRMRIPSQDGKFE